MKAYLIDSFNHTVTPYEVNEKTSLEDMQAAVGGMIEVATELDYNDVTNTLFVNEEGLFESHKNWFKFTGAHQPFKGNGLLIGTDHSSGDTVDTNLKLEDVKRMVEFVTEQDVQNSLI